MTGVMSDIPHIMIFAALTFTKVFHLLQTLELVMMVGCPASGKSTFRKRFLEPHGYVAINRDTLGTMDKCIKVRDCTKT
jgi:bifunctional polynucleotide phosphatase/kinase